MNDWPTLTDVGLGQYCPIHLIWQLTAQNLSLCPGVPAIRSVYFDFVKLAVIAFVVFCEFFNDINCFDLD